MKRIITLFLCYLLIAGGALHLTAQTVLEEKSVGETDIVSLSYALQTSNKANCNNLNAVNQFRYCSSFMLDGQQEIFTSELAIPFAEGKDYYAFSSSIVNYEGQQVELYIQDYDQQNGWSSWRIVPLDLHGSTGDESTLHTNVVFLEKQKTKVKLRLTGTDIEGIEIITMYQNSSFVDESKLELKTASSYRNSASCNLPAYFQRSAWGPTQQCSNLYTDVTHAVVHHQAGSPNPPAGGGYADVIKSIFNGQINRAVDPFCDIGYNFVIAPNGTLWEGRAGFLIVQMRLLEELVAVLDTIQIYLQFVC